MLSSVYSCTHWNKTRRMLDDGVFLITSNWLTTVVLNYVGKKTFLLHTHSHTADMQQQHSFHIFHHIGLLLTLLITDNFIPKYRNLWGVKFIIIMMNIIWSRKQNTLQSNEKLELLENKEVYHSIFMSTYLWMWISRHRRCPYKAFSHSFSHIEMQSIDAIPITNQIQFSWMPAELIFNQPFFHYFSHLFISPYPIELVCTFYFVVWLTLEKRAGHGIQMCHK